MPTTTRGSELPRSCRLAAVHAPSRRAARRPARGAAAGLAASLALGAACATSEPSHVFELSPESPQHRAAQTRFFETRDDVELLSASAAVLQDLGFHLEESVRELGFLRAAKERERPRVRAGAAAVLRAARVLGPAAVPIDLHQQIAATLVAATANNGGHATRGADHVLPRDLEGRREGRGPYLSPGEQSMEMIRDPVIYQQFFADSPAVFLEAFTL